MPFIARSVAAVAGLLCGGAAFAAGPIQDPPSPEPCVAVVAPSVRGAGSARQVGDAVSDLFISYLNGPALRAIALEARLPAQAIIEARQKGCDRVLITSVVRTRPRGSTVGKVLGDAAGATAWHTPYGRGAGAAVARRTAVATAREVSRLASETRRQDAMELAYRVAPPDAVVAATPTTVKATAKVDGEDLLTTLVERASQDVFTSVTR